MSILNPVWLKTPSQCFFFFLFFLFYFKIHDVNKQFFKNDLFISNDKAVHPHFLKICNIVCTAEVSLLTQ